MNRLTLMGHLGNDPSLKMTNSGTAVMTLRLATKERRKAANGEWGDHTEWHSAVVWGKQAEALEPRLKKGSFVFLEGPVRQREYSMKDGEKRRTFEVHAVTLQILSGRNEPSERGTRPTSSGGGYSEDEYNGPDNDDIPF